MSDAGGADAAIVVGVDDSPAALRATTWAAVSAAGHGRPLHLVSVIDPVVPYGTGIGLAADHFVELEAEGHARLDAARAVAEREIGPGFAHGPRVSAELAVDRAPALLTERAQSAFRVVIGGPADAAATRPLGPVAAALLSHAPCQVAVVRSVERPRRRPGPVVVGVDGSPASVSAMWAAFDEAAATRNALIAVHAAGGSTRQRLRHRRGRARAESEIADRFALVERFADLRQWYPEVEVDPVVAEEEPATALLSYAATAALLVVGTTGHGELRGRLLGSTSHELARSARCPLLVVPEPSRTRGHHTRRKEKAGS